MSARHFRLLAARRVTLPWVGAGIIDGTTRSLTRTDLFRPSASAGHRRTADHQEI
jgi:hypothetical protein